MYYYAIDNTVKTIMIKLFTLESHTPYGFISEFLYFIQFLPFLLFSVIPFILFYTTECKESIIFIEG